MKTFDTRIQNKRDTTANWNKATEFIPLPGEVIIYTDRHNENDKIVPGIKIGDGITTIVNLPFIDEVVKKDLKDHTDNNEIHITQEERTSWNNKLNCEYNNENLIFNRN